MASEHKTAAVVGLVFLVAVVMAPAVAVRRASVVPVAASHGQNVTAEDDKVLDAIDLCFEKALNASSSAAATEKFPLFETTLAKSLKELNDHKYIPKVEAASKVASSAAAGATSPDEKFAVYFARLTQVLVGTVDAEKRAAAEKQAAAAATQPPAAAGTQPGAATAAVTQPPAAGAEPPVAGTQPAAAAAAAVTQPPAAATQPAAAGTA